MYENYSSEENNELENGRFKVAGEAAFSLCFRTLVDDKGIDPEPDLEELELLPDPVEVDEEAECGCEAPCRGVPALTGADGYTTPEGIGAA